MAVVLFWLLVGLYLFIAGAVVFAALFLEEDEDARD